MADAEQAKTDFQTILTSLDRKFDIIHVRWTEDKLFEAKFRTQIQRNSDDFNALCDDWVDLFSEATSTVWVKKISNTGPKIRFRKQYQCWTQSGKEVQKELLFDARRCKGTLDIKVLTDNPLTRRKNKHIRVGLNVVVKINFNHLHKVNTTLPFAFFVHTCEPLPEAPKPVLQSNEKISQKVAEIVQKGLNASSKVVSSDLIPTSQSQILEKNMVNILSNKLFTSDIEPKIMTSTLDMQAKAFENDQLCHHNSLQMLNLEQLQFNQILPIVNTSDTIKLQVQPHLQQFTQVVVAAPQLDMTEPLLMCQPTLMFDPSQVIPVTAHPIPHHFVQVHSHNIGNHHGQYS